LKRDGFRVQVIKGAWDVNDINAVARKSGSMRVYLPEFSEALLPERLNRLCKAIARRLNDSFR
jgi:hypothetical protein